MKVLFQVPEVIRSYGNNNTSKPYYVAVPLNNASDYRAQFNLRNFLHGLQTHTVWGTEVPCRGFGGQNATEAAGRSTEIAFAA